uniref:Uncharacterized protein n=1 Tax=Hyaloperonospora arabidopsidis (strain Emoy2) TaxID=559515 RepID=M4BZN9_HYAAE
MVIHPPFSLGVPKQIFAQPHTELPRIRRQMQAASCNSQNKRKKHVFHVDCLLSNTPRCSNVALLAFK